MDILSLPQEQEIPHGKPSSGYGMEAMVAEVAVWVKSVPAKATGMKDEAGVMKLDSTVQFQVRQSLFQFGLNCRYLGGCDFAGEIDPQPHLIAGLKPWQDVHTQLVPYFRSDLTADSYRTDGYFALCALAYTATNDRFLFT